MRRVPLRVVDDQLVDAGARDDELVGRGVDGRAPGQETVADAPVEGGPAHALLGGLVDGGDVAERALRLAVAAAPDAVADIGERLRKEHAAGRRADDRVALRRALVAELDEFRALVEQSPAAAHRQCDHLALLSIAELERARARVALGEILPRSGAMTRA